MTLAFNVAVPLAEMYRWIIVLLLAPSAGASSQLTTDCSPDRPHPYYTVKGPEALRYNAHDNDDVRATFLPDGWWMPEWERAPGKKTEDYWRWSKGDCSLALHNPHPFALVADMTFGFATVDDRHVTIKSGPTIVWQGELKPANDNASAINGITLPPGDTVLEFHGDRPPSVPAQATTGSLRVQCEKPGDCPHGAALKKPNAVF